MNNNTQFVNRNKMLVLQNLAKQRQEVKLQLLPLVKTGQRFTRLFSSQQKEQVSHSKMVLVTGIALFLAILGKRRGGWLGKIARYTIVNYPGLLHKIIIK